MVELIVVIGLCAAFLFSVSGVISVGVMLTRQAGRRVQAVGYLREGATALHWLRDAGWAANITPLSLGAAYYVVFNGTTKQYETTAAEPVLLDGLFQRQFTISSVQRDSSDTIAGSGTVDPGTKLVTLQSSWRDGTTTSTESLSFYLMDIWGN